MRTAQTDAVAPTRKTVTVLFSDLSGSTALGERVDPESVRSLMSPLYASMRREVEDRDGTVIKFVGDGVMAVFGVPDVHEDDAIRALEAARGMQDALDRLSRDFTREYGGVLSIKFGVNTGEVVVGEGDEDVVGDCVNVASRLEGVAAPGEILVGEDTWRLTRSIATYESVAPLRLKGKTEPVPSYRFVSFADREEPRTSTFVGRDTEVARLVSVFDEAVHVRASRLVTIIGSPGMGKTRLARELGEVLTDRALVIEARCDADGSATFAPVATALRAAAGIDEAAEPAAVIAAIKGLVPEDRDRARIAERAGALLGVGEPGTTEETFWAIRRLIETAARDQPMVVVLDDLHWAEPLLLDLVEHLAEWNRTSPVLLVLTGRPELRDIRPSLAEGGRSSVVISLEGLDVTATEALARGLLGTDRVPSELLARLPNSTEGNPLFVREFVRMLVDDGVLARSDSGWVTTIDVDAIEAPPTIHSLLAARVDRLSPSERAVLELASVVGKEFYRGAVVDLAPASIAATLDTHLQSLRRKELVEPTGTYWIDEPVFRFHHALIRDAAYRRLLKESRAELHERVAAWLERKTDGLPDEHHELIGFHLEQAHESRVQLGMHDDHARELGARAGSMLTDAATTALDRDDLPGAAALSGRALERHERSDPLRHEALIVHCEALLATGDVTAAAPVIAEFIESADTPRLKAWATCFACELTNMTDTSRLHDSVTLVSKAAIELAELGDPAGAAKAHTVQAGALARLGRFEECESTIDLALNAAREAGDRRRITAVLGAAPEAALWGPSPVSRAGGRCIDVIRLVRLTTGSPAVDAASRRCSAVLDAFRGRTDAARDVLRSSREAVEALGLRHGLYETEMFLGMVDLVAGDDAREHLRSAYEGFSAMGVDVDTARAAALLARAHLGLGEVEEAERLAAISERLGGDDLKSAITWRGVRAEILAMRGEFDEALRVGREAVHIAARTDALFDHGAACMALVLVCRMAGDVEGARRAAREAADCFGRKGADALVERFGIGSISHTPEHDTGDTIATRAVEQYAGFGAEARQTVKVYGEHLALTRWGGAETTRFTLIQVDDEGAVTDVVSFGPDALEDAKALMEERHTAMATESFFGHHSSRLPLTNLASRSVDRFIRAVVDGRWDDHADQILPTFHLIDTRAGSSYEYDKAGQVEASKVFIDIGFVTGDSSREIEAIRGESFCIYRLTLVASNGSILEILYLVEVDDAGRLMRGVAFDPENVEAAVTELDEWYVASRPEGTWNPEFVSCMNVGDWDGLRRLTHPDFIEADLWTESQRAAIGPHVRVRPVSVERDDEDGCLVRLRDVTSGKDSFHAYAIRHGLIAGHEVFDDLASALK